MSRYVPRAPRVVNAAHLLAASLCFTVFASSMTEAERTLLLESFVPGPAPRRTIKPNSRDRQMPMSFPEMKDLLEAAKTWKFRAPSEGESEADYRNALADHVRPKDRIEAYEIRTGKGWDQWTQAEQRDMLIRG